MAAAAGAASATIAASEVALVRFASPILERELAGFAARAAGLGCGERSDASRLPAVMVWTAGLRLREPFHLGQRLYLEAAPLLRGLVDAELRGLGWSGEASTRAAFLARHPEHANDLVGRATAACLFLVQVNLRYSLRLLKPDRGCTDLLAGMKPGTPGAVAMRRLHLVNFRAESTRAGTGEKLCASRYKPLHAGALSAACATIAAQLAPALEKLRRAHGESALRIHTVRLWLLKYVPEIGIQRATVTVRLLRELDVLLGSAIYLADAGVWATPDEEYGLDANLSGKVYANLFPHEKPIAVAERLQRAVVAELETRLAAEKAERKALAENEAPAAFDVRVPFSSLERLLRLRTDWRIRGPLTYDEAEHVGCEGPFLQSVKDGRRAAPIHHAAMRFAPPPVRDARFTVAAEDHGVRYRATLVLDLGECAVVTEDHVERMRRAQAELLRELTARKPSC